MTVYDVLRHSQGPTFQSRMKCGAAPDGAALDAHGRDSGLISFLVFFFSCPRATDRGRSSRRRRMTPLALEKKIFVRLPLSKVTEGWGVGRGISVTSATSNCHIAVRPPSPLRDLQPSPSQPATPSPPPGHLLKAVGKVSRQLGSVDIVPPTPSNTRVMLSWIPRQLSLCNMCGFSVMQQCHLSSNSCNCIHQ